MAPTLLISSTKLSKFQDPPQLPPSRRSTGHRSHVTAPQRRRTTCHSPTDPTPKKHYHFSVQIRRSPQPTPCPSPPRVHVPHHHPSSRSAQQSACILRCPRAALPTPSPSMLLRYVGGRSCALHGFLSAAAVSGCSPCSVERWHPCIFRGHCDDPSAQQFKALSQMVVDSVAFQSSEGSRENGCRKGYPRFRSEE